MKKKLFFLLWPLVAAAWLACCRKDPPTPIKKDPCPWPEATTEGLNTFACKIDGKEWVACIDPWLWSATSRPTESLFNEKDSSDFLSVVAQRSIIDSTTSNLGFDGQIFLGFGPCREGDFSIPKDLIYSSIKLIAYWESPTTSYETIDTTATNTLTIMHLDKDKNTVSGKMSCSLIDKETGKKIEISDGRFDLTYYPQ